MRLSEFCELLDHYEGDPSEWPLARWAEAIGLLKTSLEAQNAFEEARLMKILLREMPAPAPSPDAIDRVMARIQEHERHMRKQI
jgi:hypothetical protein